MVYFLMRKQFILIVISLVTIHQISFLLKNPLEIWVLNPCSLPKCYFGQNCRVVPKIHFIMPFNPHFTDFGPFMPRIIEVANLIITEDLAYWSELKSFRPKAY